MIAKRASRPLVFTNPIWRNGKPRYNGGINIDIVRMRADQARQIPIHHYLERAGIKPARSVRNGRELWYASPIREGDDHPSFKVDTDKNLWFDHGAARGGNVIDLVIEMRRVTVAEALAILESGFAGSVPARGPRLPENHGAPAGEKEKDEDEAFALVRSGPIEHPALLQYLDARCIARDVAHRYLKEIRFKPRGKLKQYFALGFPCGDGFDARSPVFKGFVGKDKTISHIKASGEARAAVVFEGFMNFLSLLTMQGVTEIAGADVIILHSTSLRRRAAELINGEGYESLTLYLDNDEAGRSATAFLAAETRCASIHDASTQYAGYNDLNDWLNALRRR